LQKYIISGEKKLKDGVLKIQFNKNIH